MEASYDPAASDFGDAAIRLAGVTAQVREIPEEESPELSAWQLAGPRARSRRRRLLLLVVVGFTVLTAVTGFPTGREVLTFWLLVTLLAACSGDVRLWRRAVVRDWLPLLGVLFAYDLLRGVANEVGGYLFDLDRYRSATSVGQTARAHLTEPIAVDKALFGGHVPTVWLQEQLFTPGVAHWYDAVIVPVYLSHFLVSLLLAVVLWCVNYQLFRRYLTALITVTVAALATYVLYPAAPPWMAALNDKLGVGVPIHRVVQETLVTLGGNTLNSAVEQGAAYSNPVAAMPSLHAAIPLMLALFFWSSVRLRGKIILALYAGGMAFALVYGGEHYVIDILVGWVYALVTVLTLRALERRRAAPSSSAV